MSTTSASCCCEEIRVKTALYVKGSDTDAVLPGLNESSLNLYLAEAEKCVPCEQTPFHGGIGGFVFLEETYTGIGSDGRPVLLNKTPLFILPYGNGDVSGSLKYFPRGSLISIDHEKETFKINNQPYLIPRIEGDTIYDTIKKIKDTGPQYFDVKENKDPFTFCDCFTDALYTSTEKTKKENFRATIQQALCSGFRVGINANNIIWKPSIYMGRHDTSIKDRQKRIYPPGEFMAREFIESGGTKGELGPAQREHATTIFLPNSLKKSNLTRPMALNMSSITGKFTSKAFRDDSGRPPLWAPWYVGQIQDTAKTKRFANIRLLLAVLRYAPDGFRGNPFVYNSLSQTRPLYEGPNADPRLWTDPDEIDWNVYDKAVSKVLTPDNPVYETIPRVLSRASKNGILIESAKGCLFTRASNACDGGGGGGGLYGECPGNTEVYSFTPAGITSIPRSPNTDVVGQRVNIQYADKADSILAQAANSRNKSIVYFTVNDDLRTCPPSPPSYEGSGSSKPCGPSQRGACCVYPPSTSWNSGTAPRKFNCSACRCNYLIGFPSYGVYKYKNKKPTVQLSSGNYYKIFNFISHIQLASGCGSLNIGSGGLQHVQTETIPKAWWCSDAGQELANTKITEPQSNDSPRYVILPFKQFYTGTPAIFKTPRSTGNFSEGGSSIWTDSNEFNCLPGNGTACLVCTNRLVYQPDCPGYFESYIIEQVSGCNIEGNFGCDCDATQWEIPETETIEWDSFSPCIESITVESRTATPVTYCEYYASLGELNPQVLCCRDDADRNPCNNLDDIGVSPDNPVCTPTEDGTRTTNPFVVFTSGRINYSNILDQFGSKFNVRKYNGINENTVKGGGWIPNSGSSITEFTTSDYKQSLITNLYGKQLEFGDISLKPFAPLLERTYGQTLASKWETLPSISRMGVNGQARLTDRTARINGVLHISPEWPQALNAPEINKINKSEISERDLNNSKEKEEIKLSFEKWLSGRTRKEAPQFIRYPEYTLNYEPIVELYWVIRMIYELADVFAINYNSEITTDYYPQGIPDLQYTDKKLIVKGNGEIEVKKVGLYELNYFYSPLEDIITFDFE